MFLVIFYIVYFILVFVLRSYLLWKKTGVRPLTFSKEDNAHGYNGKVFAIISLLELTIISLYALFPKLYKFLLPFWYLENEALVYIGWVLLIYSLILVCFAQYNMRDSWRIGIDKENKTDLVTDGLFSISRNPVFLGIMIANIGLFLVIPNAFMLVILALSAVSINTQIRLEEEFLSKEYGQQYIQYKSKVNRWFTFQNTNNDEK